MRKGEDSRFGLASHALSITVIRQHSQNCEKIIEEPPWFACLLSAYPIGRCSTESLPEEGNYPMRDSDSMRGYPIGNQELPDYCYTGAWASKGKM
jgi:hypothetical protein